MKYYFIIFFFLTCFPLKAQINKIDINFASNMPLKAIESPNAKANLIMFIGGPGLKHGKLKKIGNPLIRARKIFKQKGFNLYFFPNPKKGKEISIKYRTSKKHVNNISKVYEIIKKRNNLPTFLVGHSRGGTSVSKAATVYVSKFDGIVVAAALTSTSQKISTGQLVTKILKKETDTHILVIHPKQDACFVTPFKPIPNLMNNLKSKSKKLVTIEGGGTSGKECGPYHRHGFEDKENELAEAIKRWFLDLGL